MHRADCSGMRPKPVTEATEMSASYLDTFLAFLGMTFGLVSVMPSLFFYGEAEKKEKSQAVRPYPATIGNR